MKSIEYLTALVLAKRSLDLELGSEAVLWADLLLAQGTDFDEVKNLVCLKDSSSKAQAEKLVDDCLTKLGIELVDEKFAHAILVWVWMQKLIHSEISADVFLENMHKLCVDFEHEPVYMQFYLLCCVRKDLEKNSVIVFHDREVNENNFEQVLRWEVDLFLEQNEDRVLNLIKGKQNE